VLMGLSDDDCKCSASFWSIQPSISSGVHHLSAIKRLLLSKEEGEAVETVYGPSPECGRVLAGARLIRLTASDSAPRTTKKIYMRSDDFEVYRLRTWSSESGSVEHRFFEFEVGMSEFDLLIEKRRSCDARISAHATICLPTEHCRPFCELLQMKGHREFYSRRNEFMNELQQTIFFRSEYQSASVFH
jgi:hypothetical protein